jgi:hypothetical protein
MNSTQAHFFKARSLLEEVLEDNLETFKLLARY